MMPSPLPDFELIPALLQRISRLRHRWGESLMQRSRQLGRFLDARMDTIIPGWITLTLIATALKVIGAPNRPENLVVALGMSLPFLALAAAPVIGYRIACGAFPDVRLREQPHFRLARYGKWRAAQGMDVARAAMAGPTGFLVSLIAGLLLNVPVRSLEFLAVVPAIHPLDPSWAHVLVTAMTCDVVLMNFAYMVCFVMALRAHPLFPRMLLLAWALDLILQLAIAHVIGATAFPEGLIAPLTAFLDGNIKKVMISAVLWLPYLLLSDQVNLVFRHRVRVAA